MKPTYFQPFMIVGDHNSIFFTARGPFCIFTWKNQTVGLKTTRRSVKRSKTGHFPVFFEEKSTPLENLINKTPPNTLKLWINNELLSLQVWGGLDLRVLFWVNFPSYNPTLKLPGFPRNRAFLSFKYTFSIQQHFPFECECYFCWVHPGTLVGGFTQVIPFFLNCFFLKQNHFFGGQVRKNENPSLQGLNGVDDLEGDFPL